MQIIIQILSAFCASFGFALIFRLQGKSVLFASLGGALTWGVFLLCRLELSNLFLLNLIAAAFAAFYSEAMARVCKMPATSFLAPSIIPLVPGGSLYYTLLYLIGKEEQKSSEAGVNTLLTAGGIAVGVVLVSVIVRFLSGHFWHKTPESTKKVVKKM